MGKLRIFLAGLGWGGWWIGELTAYPGWEFFALAALLVGVGDLLVERIPVRRRPAVEFALLLAVALLPSGAARTLLLPIAFGCALGGSLRETTTEWRVSRQFCGGLLLGTMLALKSVPVFFAICLLGAAIPGFPGLKKRFAATLIGTVAVYLLPAVPPPALPPPPPGSLLCALAALDPAKPEPEVVILSRGYRASAKYARFSLPPANIKHWSALPFRMAPADLIFAVDLPHLADGGVRMLARQLAPGGVLVLPRASAAHLPRWEWHVLPGTDGKYLIAGKNHSLDLSPDGLDARLQRRYSPDSPARPIAGALAGMLFDQPDRVFRVVPGGFSDVWWLVPGIAAALVLGFGVTPRPDAPKYDSFRLFLNCAGVGMVMAFCIPALLEKIDLLPGITQLIFVLGLFWIFRRPAPGHDRIALAVGALSALALLGGGVFLTAFALLGGGYAFASLDAELRSRLSSPVEPLRFLGLACGVTAVGLATVLSVPLPWLLGGIFLCRAYSLFRT